MWRSDASREREKGLSGPGVRSGPPGVGAPGGLFLFRATETWVPT